MKLIISAIALLVTSSAFAVRAPEGKHLTKSCVSFMGPELKVRVYADTQDQNFHEVVLEANGTEKAYKATVTVVADSRDVVYSSRVPGGMMTLTLKSNSRQGQPNAVLSSAVYGAFPKNTLLVCGTVMY